MLALGPAFGSITFPIASSNADCLTGVVRSNAIPASCARASSPGRTPEESMMMGALKDCGALRSCFASEKPSVSGIIASTRTRSKLSAIAIRSAFHHCFLGRAGEQRNHLPIRERLVKMRRFVALSSTTRTRRPRTFFLASLDDTAVFEMGKSAVKWNTLPSPGVLSTQIFPCICSTSFMQIPKPRPVPPYCRVVEPSAWTNASKMSFCLSFGIPVPVSRTEKCRDTSAASRLSLLISTAIFPRAVNLIALSTRLVMICRSRAGRPREYRVSGDRSARRVRGLWRERGPRGSRESCDAIAQTEVDRFQLQMAGLDL